jgi:peroxiredoxin
MKQTIQATGPLCRWALGAMLVLSFGLRTNAQVSFEIVGRIFNPPLDTMRLWDVYGNELRQVTFAVIDRSSDPPLLRLNGTVPHKGVYILAFEPQPTKAIEVVLGEEPRVSFTADYLNFPASYVVNESTSNQNYRRLVATQFQYQMQLRPVSEQYRTAFAMNRADAPVLRAKLDSLMQEQYKALLAFTEVPGLVGLAAKMLAYPPYAEGQSIHPTEAEYFREEFLKTYNGGSLLGYVPMWYHKVLQYITTGASNYGLSNAVLLQSVNSLVEQLPRGSKSRLLALVGATHAGGQLLQGNNAQGKELFAAFGERLLDEFPNDQMARQMAEEIQRAALLRVGKVAPDIVMADSTGAVRKLSELRGKVVLVDFWASWCRPCRAENPNVVRAYAQYHAKGFEVFSVSLDNNADRWKQAIAQDNLTWPHHVSDLLGWQNAAAKLYGVNSIPFTLLIDREGRIVASNLRGPALEAKLRELLP